MDESLAHCLCANDWITIRSIKSDTITEVCRLVEDSSKVKHNIIDHQSKANSVMWSIMLCLSEFKLPLFANFCIMHSGKM